MKTYEKEKAELILEDGMMRAFKIFSSAASTGWITDLEAERMAINEAMEWVYEQLDREFPDG